MSAAGLAAKTAKADYETVSRKNLGEAIPDYPCTSPDAAEGYPISKAWKIRVYRY